MFNLTEIDGLNQFFHSKLIRIHSQLLFYLKKCVILHFFVFFTYYKAVIKYVHCYMASKKNKIYTNRLKKHFGKFQISQLFGKQYQKNSFQFKYQQIPAFHNSSNFKKCIFQRTQKLSKGQRVVVALKLMLSHHHHHHHTHSLQNDKISEKGAGASGLNWPRDISRKRQLIWSLPIRRVFGTVVLFEIDYRGNLGRTWCVGHVFEGSGWN